MQLKTISSYFSENLSPLPFHRCSVLSPTANTNYTLEKSTISRWPLLFPHVHGADESLSDGTNEPCIIFTRWPRISPKMSGNHYPRHFFSLLSPSRSFSPARRELHPVTLHASTFNVITTNCFLGVTFIKGWQEFTIAATTPILHPLTFPRARKSQLNSSVFFF